MGSTAIKGMPGELHQSLRSLWIQKCCPGMKKENEHWFYGGDGKKSHIGRVNLRFVPTTHSSKMDDYLAFRDFCNTNSDAFEAYKSIKLQKADLGSKAEG